MKEIIKYIPDISWESPAGFDLGIEQIVIKNTLDEVNKTGVRTRIVRFGTGSKTSKKFIHDYHEEVYLISGDQVLLDESTLKPESKYEKGAYFIREAGTYHGPFSSENGCILFEIHYY